MKIYFKAHNLATNNLTLAQVALPLVVQGNGNNNYQETWITISKRNCQGWTSAKSVGPTITPMLHVPKSIVMQPISTFCPPLAGGNQLVIHLFNLLFICPHPVMSWSISS